MRKRTSTYFRCASNQTQEHCSDGTEFTQEERQDGGFQKCACLEHLGGSSTAGDQYTHN